MKYADKLRDPRWQKKRMEIFERDNWTCKRCGETEETLMVHHRYYIRNREPWDYDPRALVTLCQTCHEAETECMSESEQTLLESIKRKFFASDLLEIATGIENMPLLHATEVLASVYKWALETPEIQQELIDRFFESIQAKRQKGK